MHILRPPSTTPTPLTPTPLLQPSGAAEPRLIKTLSLFYQHASLLLQRDPKSFIICVLAALSAIKFATPRAAVAVSAASRLTRKRLRALVSVLGELLDRVFTAKFALRLQHLDPVS